MESSRERLEQQIRNAEAECRRVEGHLKAALEARDVDREAFKEIVQQYADLLVRLKDLRDQLHQGPHLA